ncbi:type II secretion system F family protein [Croceibacter atlanticus]|uniref:type II secretion system F family protein n=2 Tax=Pseudomonadati TaxID=3379134 RepID=UPI001C5CF811|nr:type II secretion system F family protein [Croceibacter atlanticus]MBW4970767.1 type II secretion system F family protein [Croceibacter atlanticus]WSP34298.1 type II secretion system F family protein [Croceibacter atlanticus]
MGLKLEHIRDTKKKKQKQSLENILKTEIKLFGPAFKNKQKESFYIELSVLLKAGVNLKNALAIQIESENKAAIKSILENLQDAIINGSSLSKAIKAHRSFTEYEYYSLKIGEETGTLVKVAESLGKFFERKNEQRRTLITALTYPIIILCTSVLVIVFMLRYVVPMFEDIFKQNNVELPAVTKVIMNASKIIENYSLTILFISIGMILILKYLMSKLWFKSYIQHLLLRIPFIGVFINKVQMAQFTQAVALLSAAKVPILNSIQLVKNMLSFKPIQDGLDIVEKNIIKGKSLSESLAQSAYFDSKMIALVKVSEETNQTEYIFERLNLQYNTEVQQQSKLVSTVLEPLIIVFVGLFVGIILIAMYLPMFRLGSVLG